MKIIELLNKIANGEEVPKKIKYDNIEYEEEPCYMLYNATGECNESQLINLLNDQVEIIEEDKKIEKLENEIEFYSYSKYKELKNDVDKILYILKAINLTENKINNLNNKLNEIIDKANSLEKNQ